MENDINITQNNNLTYGRRYVYSIQYHIVWCTKYRKQILTNGIDEEIKEYLKQMSVEYPFQIMAMEVMPDHIHLLLNCKPQFFSIRHDKNMKREYSEMAFYEAS